MWEVKPVEIEFHKSKDLQARIRIFRLNMDGFDNVGMKVFD